MKSQKHQDQNTNEPLYHDDFDCDKPLVLSDQDRDLVLDLLFNPPKPNQALLDAVKNNIQHFIK